MFQNDIGSNEKYCSEISCLKTDSQTNTVYYSIFMSNVFHIFKFVHVTTDVSQKLPILDKFVLLLQRTKQSVLDILTPDDIRMLMETEDEVCCLEVLFS